MEIISLHYPLNDIPESLKGQSLSIAIGHFDGVHRGHQNVIKQAVHAAKQSGSLSAVMTFHPHPKEVLGQGEHYFSCLTPFDVKKALFEQLDVDIVFVMQFDLTFASIMPQQFVEDVLLTLNAKHVIIGFDFTFGFKGQGNAELMKNIGQPDIDVQIVEPLYENGVKVSSTYIRAGLEKGDIALVTSLLGRPYEVEGIVVSGDGRGRTIGFPTANIDVTDPYVMPRLGVFGITGTVGGKTYYGVLNHGMKPTFNKEGIQPVMEAHLFDFNQDIYGESIRIQLHSFVRTEKKFSSVDELIGQIAADAAYVKSLFHIE